MIKNPTGAGISEMEFLRLRAVDARFAPKRLDRETLEEASERGRLLDEQERRMREVGLRRNQP